VVSYDRAGLGWSDLRPMPRTADRLVEELHTLLKRAAIPPPYILVGHSFGGLTMPLFAARFSDEVAGMVLVDPVAAAEWNPPSEHDLKLTRTAPERRRAEHAAIAARLPKGEHVFAENSNHWIMQEAPHLVIRAIEKVIHDSEKVATQSMSAR